MAQYLLGVMFPVTGVLMWLSRLQKKRRTTTTYRRFPQRSAHKR